MEKLIESNRKELLEYLKVEPEYNIFIVGDIYNFGIENPIMDFYVQRDDNGQLICVLMRYQQSFIFYSHCPRLVDVGVVAAQIQTAHACSCIGGKQEAVELLIPFFPCRPVKSDHMAVLRTKPDLWQVDATPTRLLPDQAREIIDLYTQIEEFASEYKGHEDTGTENTRTNLQKGGRCYGIHKDGRLIAAASTSAESDSSAMVVGVCTHPDYRGRGYASALVAKLCSDCMDEGLSSLCLFYDNPDAGRIYRGVGFSEMGLYMMLRRDTSEPTSLA